LELDIEGGKEEKGKKEKEERKIDRCQAIFLLSSSCFLLSFFLLSSLVILF